MSDANIHRLLVLLEYESTALQRADLQRLERLLPRKAALLARIEAAQPADSPLLRRLRDRAAGNARLFEALIAGMSEARAMIGALREGARGKTYARDGARALLEPAPGMLHRRA